MAKTEYTIVQWMAAITDDRKDSELTEKPDGMDHHFRLLDDDNTVYGYGYCNKESFAPLDRYAPDYGCTDIQYFNNGKWETL